MISKELLSEVLGFDLPTHLKIYGKKDVTAVVGDEMISINIYELMHLAKEWAFDEHKYFLASGKDIEGWFCTDRCSTDNNWLAQTEPEAIFKACEWILENKDDK